MRNILNKFKRAMLEKLIENNHKMGWEGLSDKWILNRIRQEKTEIETALRNGNLKEAKRECADVANFAMMLWDNLDHREKHQVKE